MIELGADGVQMTNKGVFKNVMRCFALAVFPMTYQFPAALFVYWNTNNIISLAQTKVQK
jgi:YidC/Oxa1 family membrane protein insertase